LFILPAKVADKGDVAGNAGDVVLFIAVKLQVHFKADQVHLLAVGIHAQGDAGAGAEGGNEQFAGAKALVLSAIGGGSSAMRVLFPAVRVTW
jgi:hypothetical protein